MAINDYKSVAQMRQLKGIYDITVAPSEAVTITESSDGDGLPLLLIGDPTAAGVKAATIRIRPLVWPVVQTSIPGIAQPVYTPHLCEMVYENIALNTAKFLLKLQIPMAKLGMRMVVYRTNAATAPIAATMVEANKQFSDDADIYNRIMGNT